MNTATEAELMHDTGRGQLLAGYMNGPDNVFVILVNAFIDEVARVDLFPYPVIDFKDGSLIVIHDGYVLTQDGRG